MHNMQDELSGPMTIEFIGGTTVEAVIDTVIVDPRGVPLFLLEGESVVHNWATITRVFRK